MFFTLSKTLWFVTDPGNVLLIVLVTGVLLLWTPWKRTGRWLLSLTALFALFFATVPVGRAIILGLENRFPILTQLPPRVDGIIVLGGVVEQLISKDRGQIAIGAAVERLTAFADLARRYPDAKLVFTGGSGRLVRTDVKEAEFVRPVLRQLGLATERVLFEDQSRNTAENASLSRRLAKPEAGEVWILITSAFHMPRAVGVFRQADWDVVTSPVDFSTTGRETLRPTFSLLGGFSGISRGLREILGLTFYRLSGRTDALFPAPRDGRLESAN